MLLKMKMTVKFLRNGEEEGDPAKSWTHQVTVLEVRCLSSCVRTCPFWTSPWNMLLLSLYLKWQKNKEITLRCPGQEAGPGVLHFSEISCIKEFSHHWNYQDEDGIVQREKNHAKPARKSGGVVKILQMTGRLLIPIQETTLQHERLFPFFR